jgi:archaellum component FlaG (FlaF/FlaG flagellin family)
MSLETAESVFGWANWALVAALVIGVLATYAIILSGNVKEAYLKKEIAEANARALEAQLALEKFKAARTLSPEQQKRIADKMRRFAGQEWAASIAFSTDSLSLLAEIDSALKAAGWIRGAALGQVTVGGNTSISLFEAPGVRVQIAPSKAADLTSVAAALASAIMDEGIDATPALSADVEVKPTVIQITIGLKPQ